MLNVVVTVVLLLNGYGLYALAWASIVPTLVGVIASAVRLRTLAPDLMTSWTRPAPSELAPLIVNGFGVWLGGFGWLLLSSSNALVITFLGHPEWVPIFSCTAKVSVAATQLVWLTPDSGLVGLAQLHGEAKATPRVRAAGRPASAGPPAAGRRGGVCPARVQPGLCHALGRWRAVWRPDPQRAAGVRRRVVFARPRPDERRVGRRQPRAGRDSDGRQRRRAGCRRDRARTLAGTAGRRPGAVSLRRA